MDSYNRAQAVERSLGRVQNYVAQLSITGGKLAELQPPKADEGEAARAFTALNKSGVISGALCRIGPGSRTTSSARLPAEVGNRGRPFRIQVGGA
jgi:hypothetical protein